MKIKRLSGELLSYFVISAFGLIMLYPLLWMLGNSFKPQAEIFSSISIFPEKITFDNYIKGWRGVAGIRFSRFLVNGIILAVLCVIGNVTSCSLSAFAFSRLKFRFSRLFFSFMLITMMVPAHAVLIPQYIVFNKLRFIDTYMPLVLPKFFSVESFFIFLIIQFMRSLPKDLDEAAYVDGCNTWYVYSRIVMPLALPALVTTAIFTFMWTWNDFFSQLLYLNNPNKYTIALGLRLFMDSTGESSWGALFSMSIISLLPVLIIFVFLQKYLVEGIPAGGVKG